MTFVERIDLGEAIYGMLFSAVSRSVDLFDPRQANEQLSSRTLSVYFFFSSVQVCRMGESVADDGGKENVYRSLSLSLYFFLFVSLFYLFVASLSLSCKLKINK